MKYTKKLLALLLALVIGLGFGVPGLAEMGEYDLGDFYIIKDLEDITVKNGEEFTLKVEVNIPKGLPENAEIVYEWWIDDEYYSCADGIYQGGQVSPDMFLAPDKWHFIRPKKIRVECSVILVIMDDSEIMIDSKVLNCQNAIITFDWDDYYDLDNFYIKKQPKDLTVKYGEDFSLDIEVNVPEGLQNMRIDYDWKYNCAFPSGCYSSFTPEYHGNASGRDFVRTLNETGVEFFCEVTISDYDEKPLKTLKSNIVTVTATLPLDDFYIIKQPKSVNAKYNQQYTMNFDVNIPEDLPEDARVQYRWYIDGKERGVSSEYRGKISGNMDKIYCEVTLLLDIRIGGKNDTVSLKTLKSDVVTVTGKDSFWNMIGNKKNSFGQIYTAGFLLVPGFFASIGLLISVVDRSAWGFLLGGFLGILSALVWIPIWAVLGLPVSLVLYLTT